MLLFESSGIWLNEIRNSSDAVTSQLPPTVVVIVKSLKELNWIIGNSEVDEFINI